MITFPHAFHAVMLDKASWPDDPLQRALYGETAVARLCKQFCIIGNDAALIVLNFSIYKQGRYMH
jgi:hypothetical protein